MSEDTRYKLIQDVKAGKLPTLTYKKMPEVTVPQTNSPLFLLEEKEQQLIGRLLQLLEDS